MERPTLPEGLEEQLEGIRSGLHLRWNPQAKVVRTGQFDVYGNVIEGPEYSPRWELWDKTPDGLEYKVMTIRNPDGSFKAPGKWLIEYLHKINPANYDGSVGKMVKSLVDDPNKTLLEIGEEDFEDLIEQAAKWAVYADSPKQRVVTDLN